jgi:hypothetical protein
VSPLMNPCKEKLRGIIHGWCVKAPFGRLTGSPEVILKSW